MFYQWVLQSACVNGVKIYPRCVPVSLQAGQAKETETLIPLLYRCPNLILVGDPMQLPPTVVSQVLQTRINCQKKKSQKIQSSPLRTVFVRHSVNKKKNSETQQNSSGNNNLNILGKKNGGGPPGSGCTSVQTLNNSHTPVCHQWTDPY